jgi:ParB family transcriptional regulator, chromosome partitioning protein
MPRNALGRGLGALIREPEEARPPQPQPLRAPAGQPFSGAATGTATALAPAPSDGLLYADIDLIDPSPYQPRTLFREEALNELAQSIRASGIVQPLVVRRLADRYQLIAGERRWRAAQRAQLSRVPIVVRDVPEETALEMTLVENLQREDLNPIEQAHAFQKLTDDFHLTQEEVAQKTGKDRATIANALRLLKLEQPIQEMLEQGVLTAGHGRALLSLSDSATRLDIARRVAKGGMTVRQVERLAVRGPRVSPVPTSQSVEPNTKAALEDLQRRFGTRVLLSSRKADGSGQLILEYYSDSDLTRLYAQLMGE